MQMITTVVNVILSNISVERLWNHAKAIKFRAPVYGEGFDSGA